MTATDQQESFGPYAFSLSPAETETAAARFGLRSALRGGLIAGHLAPLAAFVLLLLFASILALTGFIGRRAGEAVVLLGAAAFMIQRLATHSRIWRARILGRAEIASLDADRTMTAKIDDMGVTLETGERSRRLDYVDCEEAEDAGGLVYLWPRDGVPVVLPARVLGEGEAERFVALIRKQMSGRRAA
jgi:hypothetical protein